MGNFLNVLRHCKEAGYQDIDEDFNIFLDFERDSLRAGRGSGSQPMDEVAPPLASRSNSEPMDQDSSKGDLDQQMKSFMRSSYDVLEFMKNYASSFGSASTLQVNSINDAKSDMWSVVVPNIFNLHRAMQLSSELEKLIPKVLDGLWSNEVTTLERFRQNDQLLIKFGRILDFAMVFDDLRLKAPGLQNDISSVKRLLAIRNSQQQEMDEEEARIINNETLQSLALFYIHPAPLLNATIQAVTTFFNSVEHSVQAEPLDLIVSYCKVCVNVLSTDYRKKFKNTGTVGLLQRVMIATALLYDHLSQDGIFVKESPISIKLIVNILRREAGELRSQRHGSFGSKDIIMVDVEQKENRLSYQELQLQAKNLLSVLKYSNKHLKDSTTPRTVQNMFKRIA